MIWDKVAPLYDAFESLSNNRVYSGTGKAVAEEIEPEDSVLECACGTGAITRYIAPKCASLIATDRSENMLRETYMKCRGYDNVKYGLSDIMHLRFRDGRFDKVVAGNVIHLLDDPQAALAELMRVCRSGGKVIIPTYINDSKGALRSAQNVLEKVGFEFKSEFDINTYKEFFANAGCTNVEYRVVEGHVPCAIAIITKE